MSTGSGDAATPSDSSQDPKDLSKLDELISYITPHQRKPTKKTRIIDEDEPLVDTTAALPLHSKKTERTKKRLERKQRKAAEQPSPTTLLDLPPELLQEILGLLRPRDVLQLSMASQAVRAFVLENENTIARDIIRRRYWVLAQCFPLPLPFDDIDTTAKPALLSERRQNMLQIHKKPYQHVKGIDPLKICTCMSCVLAWNNLCMVLDLSHWQKNLGNRIPIEMIPRGTNPEWNQKLLDKHARIVEHAMNSRLTHAAILEKHLQSTVQTISRTFRGKKTVHPKRLYHLAPVDAEQETDEFLERSGPPSYEFPWHRDNYYGLEAYVPNRKWSKEKEKWLYYAEGLHERDLQWVKEKFTPVDEIQRDKPLTEFIEGFKANVAI
jgi:hypothetical protein